MFNPNITTIQPKVENCGWTVGNIVFQSGIAITELHVHLRKSFTIGKEEKGKAKATLEALKFIEELLADDSSKKDDKEGVQTLKNETQRLKENSQTKEEKRGIEAIRAIEKDLRQYEKEYNIKANDSSNSEISEFDFVDDKNENEENGGKEVEEE
uniref:DRBM domain-containing protein n=1 Tax=Meloidogyne javanica TaxID=6303 RepID=A0A915ME19_MELJA